MKTWLKILQKFRSLSKDAVKLPTSRVCGDSRDFVSGFFSGSYFHQCLTLNENSLEISVREKGGILIVENLDVLPGCARKSGNLCKSVGSGKNPHVTLFSP